MALIRLPHYVQDVVVNGTRYLSPSGLFAVTTQADIDELIKMGGVLDAGTGGTPEWVLNADGSVSGFLGPDGTTKQFASLVSGALVLDKATGKGIKVYTTTPTYPWRDNIGTIKTRTGGGAAPSFAVYQGGIYQFSFGTGAGDTEVFNEYHVLHDQVPNTDQYIHAHWSCITAATGNANWLFDVSYAKGYAQAAFEGTAASAAPITVSVTQAGSGTAFTHQIAEVQFVAENGLISPAAVNVSISSSSATLTAASALFTNADIGRTVRVVGAGAAGGNLDTTISAFTSTTQVTLANNASTTVTAQDAFRYRVIDRALIEVDGMFIVRTWRNSARAADTLDVAPFLHFVDLHYQSTGIGTKQRNGPAFYT